jgi:hypothetical protein
MHRRRSLGEGIQQALVGRHARRRRSDYMHHQPLAADCPPEVIKAKSTVTATTTTAAGGVSKQRPVFRRGKITDPAICARNSKSLMSTATSTTFVPEEGVAEEDSWYSSDDDNGSVAAAMAVVEVERKVHFRVNDKDEIVTDIVPDNTGGRWFQQKRTATSSLTGNDFRQIVIDAQTYITRIKVECPQIVEILARMFHDQSLAAGLLSEKDAGLLFAWSSGHGRGLEDHLIAAVKKHRTHARSSVLKFQKRMAFVACQDYTQALRERSCMESQQSAAFARIMAIGDALVAESIYLGKTSGHSFIPK